MASTASHRSLVAAKVHPTKTLKAATYGDNLKITVCLVSSFTSSCSGNRDWYSATWGLLIRLPSRSWKYRNATLGVLMDCRKKPSHHLLALLLLRCSQTNPSQTMWRTTPAMGGGAHSHYTEPIAHHGDEKHRTNTGLDINHNVGYRYSVNRNSHHPQRTITKETLILLQGNSHGCFPS